jgi:hypothetical protein
MQRTHALRRGSFAVGKLRKHDAAMLALEGLHLDKPTDARPCSRQHHWNCAARAQGQLVQRRLLFHSLNIHPPLGAALSWIKLLPYQHGLRAAEFADLRWDQIEFQSPTRACAGRSKERQARQAAGFDHRLRGMFAAFKRRARLRRC